MNITTYENEENKRRGDEPHEEYIDGDPIYGFIYLMRMICVDLEQGDSGDAMIGLSHAKFAAEHWSEKLDTDDAWVEKEENPKELEKLNEGDKLVLYDSLKSIHADIEKITTMMVKLDLTKVCDDLYHLYANYENNLKDAKRIIDDGAEKIETSGEFTDRWRLIRE